MADDLHTLVPKALRTLLTETLLRADRRGAYVINRGEPGFVDTMRALPAGVVCSHPGPGRKPVVSHVNHVLFGLELVARAIEGDRQAFDNVDWDEAWKLEQVDDEQWHALVDRLEAVALRIVDVGSLPHEWNEMMLTGMLGVPAHTAYHLGAIRQILRDVISPERYAHHWELAGAAGNAGGRQSRPAD